MVIVVDPEVVEVLDVAFGWDEVVADSSAAATVSSGTSAVPTLMKANTALPARNTPPITAINLRGEDTEGSG
jgi:hypothetical protein